MTDYEFVGGFKGEFHSEKELTNWDSFRNHRDIISSFTKRHAPPFSETLCVLGAGFCDDLDLDSLGHVFRHITLVDIAMEDMQVGVNQQGKRHSDSIRLVQCDVTGIHDGLNTHKNSPDKYVLEDLLRKTAQFSPPELEDYDCVVSTCLLSQLLYHATQCIGEKHDRFVEVLKVVRLQHVRLMMKILKPGGCGLLFTDFVSSESLPELFTTTDLKKTAQKAIANQNYLHGLNPGMVSSVFGEPGVKEQITTIKVTDPWRWVVQDRIYACLGFIFDKVTQA